MLHVLQLIVAPAFALRKKSLVPFSLGVVAATVQYVLSDRTRAIYVALALLALTLCISVISCIAVHWMLTRWRLRCEVTRRPWAPHGAKTARCVFSGEPVTHRCPRCEANVNEMSLVDEVRSLRLRMVKEASPDKFLDALRPEVPGMRGRMLLDEAMACVVDWTQCSVSLCCLGCALDLRCCQVIPQMVLGMACTAFAAALAPLALLELFSDAGWRVVPSACAGVAVHLALSQPLLLYQAFSTVVAFTSLHSSVPWVTDLVRPPTALEARFAGPAHLTELPFIEETDDEE